MQAEGEEAEELWRNCLQAGDLMAHYSLGYTLYDLERYREAYRHLRAYTELVPADGWAWCWLGKACEAMGDLEQARSAYGRAIELDDGETDAPEILAGLMDGDGRGESDLVHGPGVDTEAQAMALMTPQIGFIGAAPGLREGTEIVLEDHVRRRDLLMLETTEEGTVLIRRAGPGTEGTTYYVHPESTPQNLTLVRVELRATDPAPDPPGLGKILKETYSRVGFFYRDADLNETVLLVFRHKGSGTYHVLATVHGVCSPAHHECSRFLSGPRSSRGARNPG